MHRKIPLIPYVLVGLMLIAAHVSANADNHDTTEQVRAGKSPAETLTIYLATLKNRNRSPELDIYTPATRQMLKDWVMTAPQMDNLVHTYSLCNAERARIDRSRRFAVIRYPINQRQCSPWFFEFIDGTWALDLTLMQRAIRFGRDNAWRFERGAPHPYKYAFVDWEFDSRGFPREK